MSYKWPTINITESQILELKRSPRIHLAQPSNLKHKDTKPVSLERRQEKTLRITIYTTMLNQGLKQVMSALLKAEIPIFHFYSLNIYGIQILWTKNPQKPQTG